MLFYSPFFLFFFLPLVLAIFFTVRGQLRNIVLLIASCGFYFWGEPRFFFIALLSVILDYCLAQQLFKRQGTIAAKHLLMLGIVLNVFLLCYFKYMNFFIGTINSALSVVHSTTLPMLQIILPIGVSFIVFEKITYLVDIYRKKGSPAKSLLQYMLYIFLFPKLLAGPIVKYHDIAAQLAHHNPRFADFFCGFKRFLLGLIKKVLIADTVGRVADTMFGLPPDSLGFNQAWLGLICFTIQIYFDFSAYSDMAIGLARMFGFRLLENFNMPYLATSFTDFWRRWHISLSTWIKEYLYFPLGGNRCSTIRTYFNLWVCFLISGLWHGASWTFILWGAYNGLFLLMDKLFWLRLTTKLPKIFNVMITLTFLMIGWLIFRSTSITQINYFFCALFNPWKEGMFIYITLDVWLALTIGILTSFIPLQSGYSSFLRVWPGLPIALMLENWALSALSLFAIARAIAVTFNPFLYFRF